MPETVAHTPVPADARAFSAVLFAGGKSSRMGRDKAGVIFEGQPLWERQLSTLRQLVPTELLISGKTDGPYAGAGVEIVPDVTPGCGPLSGLEAALHRSTHSLVLVLAIDLPAMNAGFLAHLMEIALEREMGVVPRLEGWFEPLAAVYPRACLPLVRECIRGEDLSMQAFVRRMLGSGMMISSGVTGEDAPLFRNVNAPSDLHE